MFRKTIEFSLSLSAWLKKRQRIAANGKPVLVNLGSGLTVAPGWFHVDASLNALVSGWPESVLRFLYRWSDNRHWLSQEQYIRILQDHRFIHHRLQYGVPFNDAKIDVLYSSHVIEHLFRDEAEALLHDAYRALKRGGLIRIAVPDLDHAVKLYLGGSKEGALTFFFSLQRAGYLNQHHYMYDYQLLSKLLASVGFHDITRCSFQDGQCPDIKVLDNRPEETLYVEARK